MLIKPCGKTLKAINYLCSQSTKTSSIDLVVYFHQRINELDLENSIQQLIDDGYITGTNRESYWTDICPTYKGKHYNEYKFLVAKEIFFKSFLVPLAVALATTLITLAVNGF